MHKIKYIANGKQATHELPKKDPVITCEKLSDLILIAVKDLEKVEKSKKYKIDMEVYHKPNSHCSVCFAGAVMAKSLKFNPSTYIDPYSFIDMTYLHRFLALDYIRSGILCEAVGHFYYNHLSKYELMKKVVIEFQSDTVGVMPYKHNPTQFKQEIKNIAERLAKIGL